MRRIFILPAFPHFLLTVAATVGAIALGLASFYPLWCVLDLTASETQYHKLASLLKSCLT
jgi:hypothetical protein